MQNEKASLTVKNPGDPAPGPHDADASTPAVAATPEGSTGNRALKVISSTLSMGAANRAAPGSDDDSAKAPPRSWLERLWASISMPFSASGELVVDAVPGLQLAKRLTQALLSSRGEASGAIVAHELVEAVESLGDADRVAYYHYLTADYQPDPDRLKAAAQAYLHDPSVANAAALTDAAEPPRQEILRRMNQTPRGTTALVAMRRDLLGRLRAEPVLRSLDNDLKHLFSSWFNRGFLQLRRIDWQSSAAVLEKLIQYEAVHEIQDWDDLRRRLAPDRRCFAFFHPALPEEPLIFVEVALVNGLSDSVQVLLEPQGAADGKAEHRALHADTAVFYSISNCQEGLRGISFGNLLIKQVVQELRAEFPKLTQFCTLSPIPGLRRWVDKRIAAGDESEALSRVAALTEGEWWLDAEKCEAVRAPLLQLCARYLTGDDLPKGSLDAVARFHLGNGARLERINWLANTAPRGINESYGLMVNYLYDLKTVEANHEAFAQDGNIARSKGIDSLLGIAPAAAEGRVSQLRRRLESIASIRRLGKASGPTAEQKR